MYSLFQTCCKSRFTVYKITFLSSFHLILHVVFFTRRRGRAEEGGNKFISTLYYIVIFLYEKQKENV